MPDGQNSQSDAREILRKMYELRMIRTWYRDNPEGWRLISGLWSPLYIQLRVLQSYPDLLRLVGERMAAMIRAEVPEVTQLVGVAFAGIPISVAASLAGNIPSAMTRKLPGVRSIEDFDKALAEYGEHALVEGELRSGDCPVIVDDLVSRFDSKLIAAEQVMREVKRRDLENVNCKHVAVVFDREQGAQEAAEKHGMSLHALIRFRSQGLDWLGEFMSPRENEVIRGYLENSEAFQTETVQRQLIEEAKKT